MREGPRLADCTRACKVCVCELGSPLWRETAASVVGPELVRGRLGGLLFESRIVSELLAVVFVLALPLVVKFALRRRCRRH